MIILVSLDGPLYICMEKKIWTFAYLFKKNSNYLHYKAEIYFTSKFHKIIKIDFIVRGVGVFTKELMTVGKKHLNSCADVHNMIDQINKRLSFMQKL